MSDDTQFDVAFRALTGHDPFPWQRELFHRLVDGNAPRSCDIPTGLGKTSAIPIWLIALVANPAKVPRRLVYIVNRRTVVDQATDVVERIRDCLLNPARADSVEHEKTLHCLVNRLRRLATTDDLPLAISTLRGELADNQEWKRDPARPAIVVGTVDMIGSKLLFSGYGDGRYWRAHHAGLLGQDTLVIHDEAHLTPAFSGVLRRIEQEQEQFDFKVASPMRVIELSATARPSTASDSAADEDNLRLGEADEDDPIVGQRIKAEKRLALHLVNTDEDKDALVKRLAELAKADDGKAARLLVYVRSPEDAQKVCGLLSQEKISSDRIALLTGTIRGQERDHLARTCLFRWFAGETDDTTTQLANGGTAYLVSTSAGEVGVDLDADHMACDLTTLDSMIQRLGRVNRRGGEGRVACVDVVASKPKDKKDKASGIESAIQATYEILQRWFNDSGGKLDVSPRCLRELLGALADDDRNRAFAPEPEAPPLTDILLDAWSLTSIAERMPARPEVAAYLHGLTHDPPETYVAWRKELSLLHDARGKHKVDSQTLREWFVACRIEARERLRDHTKRVQKALAGLLQTHRKKDRGCDFDVVLLDERGKAEWSTFATIVDKQFDLAYRTILLPVEIGGLSQQGMLDPTAVEPIAKIDVAEMATEENHRQRWLLVSSEDGEQYQRLMTGEIENSLPQDLRELKRITLQEPVEGEEEGESKYLLLMVPLRQSAFDDPETARTRQTINDHTERTVSVIGRVADKLGLEQMKDALATAAEYHDRGKQRLVWQRYACNTNSEQPLAKSAKYLHPRVLGGYRHELGSLLDASRDDRISRHPQRDLILHLIAAHHGWARPHFESQAADRDSSTQANQYATEETMRRFGRLQKRYGRWGLAWLESLLRCADALASAGTEP